MKEVINGLSLCTGYAGIELGLSIAFGKRYRTVLCCEREAFSASNLVGRMEEEALDRTPIWDDLTTLDGRPYRGLVDIITAGFPCQPFSLAGKRLGSSDERHLWPDILRIIDEVQPEWLLFENVPGLTATRTIEHRSDLLGILQEILRTGDECGPRERYHSANRASRLHRRLLKKYGISALHYVCCCLESRGYIVEWGVYSAAELDAGHERRRVFILAHASRQRGQQEHGGPLEGDVADSDWIIGRCGTAGSDRTEAYDDHGQLADTLRGECYGGTDEPIGEPEGRTTVGGTGEGDPSTLAVPCRGRGPLCGKGRQGCERPGTHEERDRSQTHGSTAECGTGVADTNGQREPQPSGDVEEQRKRSVHGIEGVEYAEHWGWNPGEADGGWEAGPLTGHPTPTAPGPGDRDTWATILAERPELAPSITDAQAESIFRGVVDATAFRLDRLRLGGNGVSPAVAALAVTDLAARIAARTGYDGIDRNSA